MVSPEIDDNIDIIEDKDINDTYRASGAGGQHVKKQKVPLESHIFPTGIVVESVKMIDLNTKIKIVHLNVKIKII